MTPHYFRPVNWDELTNLNREPFSPDLYKTHSFFRCDGCDYEFAVPVKSYLHIEADLMNFLKEEEFPIHCEEVKIWEVLTS